jgi:hypothetical protein
MPTGERARVCCGETEDAHRRRTTERKDFVGIFGKKETNQKGVFWISDLRENLG